MQEDWSGTWIVVLIAILAIASIVGWWPGKMRRAAWLFGLWLVPWLTIEVVRLWLDARDFGPAEHFDWSNFWDFSIQDARMLMGILWCGRASVVARADRAMDREEDLG